eukprot:4639000-Pleurochrysis_carterae.AAC.1
MAQGNISRFDMSREYKMRATVLAQVAAYASPLTKSINVSRSEVQAAFAKCMDEIAIVTRNKTDDFETFGDIHKAIRALGVPKEVCSPGVRYLRNTLF